MAPNITRYPPTPIHLLPTADFTGGLNLRADAFQLAENESPDMLDVTVEIGGGFVQRQVVAPYSSVMPDGNPPVALWSYQTTSVSQVIAATSAHLYAGGSWGTLATAISFPAGQRPRAAVFNNKFYAVFGSSHVPLGWNGSGLTTMGQAFNNTYGGEGASDANMPYARYIQPFRGKLFIAYTTESGTDFPNRIRFSHTNFPEDWAAADFIDIDVGRDGDFITGLAEFRDRLYIFKNNSISILTGYSTSNYQVTTIAQDMGAVSQEAICVSEVGMFYFSWPQGVYLDRTGSGGYPIFDKLWPLVRDGFIPSASRAQIAMGWVNKNLWVSVPFNGTSVNARTFVYNPWIWKNRYLRFLQGPWYPYSIPASAFATVTQVNGPTQYLAANSTSPYVGMLEQSGSTDNWGAGSTNISSYFRTKWEDAGSEAVVKRWRHPDIIMRAEGGGSILIEVRRNYDPVTVYKAFQVAPSVPNLGLKWDIGSTAPTVTNLGTPGSTQYNYKVTALIGTLEGEPSAVGTTTTGNATLSGTNKNHIAWTALSQATSYNVYGRPATGGGSYQLIGTTVATTFDDTGQALGAAIPTGSAVGGLWDDGSGLVGGSWTLPNVTAEDIVRGRSLGSAKAVQLSFYAPTGLPWGVDSVVYKYVPKRIRG